MGVNSLSQPSNKFVILSPLLLINSQHFTFVFETICGLPKLGPSSSISTGFSMIHQQFFGTIHETPHLTRRGDAKFATCHIRSSSSPLGRRCLRCKLSFDSVRMIGAETIISQNADNIDKSGFTSLWSAQLWTKHRGNLKPWDLQNLYMANFRYSAKE